MTKILKRSKKEKWHLRAKSLHGSGERPRLSVHRSAKNIYAQIIDDVSGQTLLALSSKDLKKGTKSEKSFEIGLRIATDLLGKNIKSVTFDRGGYKFHGRVKALAEGARKGGLQF